jgi:Protein of unknown function (DUF3052)
MRRCRPRSGGGSRPPCGPQIQRCCRLAYDRHVTAEKDYSGTALARKLGAKPGAEVVVFFTTRRRELLDRLLALKAALAPADGLWIAWPKKASKLETDLDFAAVQRAGLEAGLVDNKSCAIDEDWQALRFVYRLADRP